MESWGRCWGLQEVDHSAIATYFSRPEDPGSAELPILRSLGALE
jgi:hypothetical protein